MDGISALERSYEQLEKAVADLSPAQLEAATPCEGWDVRSLLNHTIGAGWMFTLANRGESIGDQPTTDLVGPDPASALAEVRAANIESWRGPDGLNGDRAFPFGTFPAAAALMINVGEVAVHSWDIARAAGQDLQIDPEVVRAVLEFYLPLPLDEYRAHGAFGPEVTVPDSASEQDRLLAYLGRRP